MDPDPIDGDQVYAAERLLQTRTRKGQQEFLVKWKGWNSKHNTWEPRANILDDRLIQEFEQRVGSRAPKRRAVGAPPSSSVGGKESTQATAAVEFGPPQPKRGRRAVKSPIRAKTDNVSDITSPSTSIGTRRSSRHSSIAKDSSVSSVVEKTKLAVETTISGSKISSNSSPTKAHETVHEEDHKKIGPNSDTEPELSTEDEEKSVLEEKKASSSYVEQKPTGDGPPVVEQPLEIYVEHTVKTEKIICDSVQEKAPATDSGNSEALIENGQSKKAEMSTNDEDVVCEDAFIITNESDPATTHKIQVYTLSDNGVSSEQKQKGTTSENKSVSMTGEMEGEITVVNNDDQHQSGSVMDTVGSSDEGNTHVTTNGQNKKTAETVVATVTPDEE